MTTTLLTVPVPTLVSLRTPRTRRDRVGWAWLPVEVEVPVLRSEAAVVIGARAVGRWVGGGQSPLHGACAAGSHWRDAGAGFRRSAADRCPAEGVDLFRARTVGGFADVDEYELGPAPCFRTALNPYPGHGDLRYLTPRPHLTDLEADTMAASRRVGVTSGSQRAFRTLAGRKGPHDPPARDADDSPCRFRLRDDCSWSMVDPDLHDAMVGMAARSLAVVDGRPMERSAPPVVLVSVRRRPFHGWRRPGTRDRGARDARDAGRSLLVGPIYQDMPAPSDTFHHAFPIDAPWIDDALRDATGPGGPFEGFEVERSSAGPDLVGWVATPPAPFEALPPGLVDAVAKASLDGRFAPYPGGTVPPYGDGGPDGDEARAALTAALLEGALPDPTTNFGVEKAEHTLRRIVRWRTETMERYPVPGCVTPESAPPELDALAF